MKLTHYKKERLFHDEMKKLVEEFIGYEEKYH